MSGVPRPTQIPHGTAACYQNNACRRPECREANRAHWEKHAAEKYAQREWIDGRWVAFGDKVRHGTATAYNYYGCRCEMCTYGRRWRGTETRERKKLQQRDET